MPKAELVEEDHLDQPANAVPMTQLSRLQMEAAGSLADLTAIRLCKDRAVQTEIVIISMLQSEGGGYRKDSIRNCGDSILSHCKSKVELRG